MNKILIIGQAPPAQEQKVPYDTTMLYDILAWVGITKEQAQEIFTFDAVYDKFPGFNAIGGHLKPSYAQFLGYLVRSLQDKIVRHQHIMILGRIAYDYLYETPVVKDLLARRNVVTLLHPSYRNRARIMSNQYLTTKELKDFFSLRENWEQLQKARNFS